MILIGIDDTDNKESRGTGYLSRQLGKLIVSERLGEVERITRHQLYVHDDIPYTSQNSSACLIVNSGSIEKLYPLCRAFLKKHGAIGSDVGLAICDEENINNEIIEYALSAKKVVLNQGIAMKHAKKNNIILEGLTGTHDGIIGALAAIGLGKYGNDGRCIWLKGLELRDLEGVYSIAELLRVTGIDMIVDKEFNAISSVGNINVGSWVRPIVSKNKIVVNAEKISNNPEYEWQVVSKEYIKGISD